MISKKIICIHLCVLALIVCCVFFNAIHSSFKMDDHDTFKDPKIINTNYFKYNWYPEPNRYLNLSIASEESSYRPVTNSILSIQYHYFKRNVELYHYVSISLFFVGGALVYFFVYMFSKDTLLALLSAVLFTVHPINGLAVNYVVASAYVYQLIMNLAVLVLFLRSIDSQKGGVAWGISLVFFVLSLGVHETP